MASGIQVYFVRNGHVASDRNIPQTVQHRVVAYPGVVTDLDFPGIGYFYRRSNLRMTPNGRAKEPKQKTPPSIQELWGPAKQGSLNNPPDLNDYF
jgi:hypothetical protein